KEFTDSLKALENVTIISSSYTGVFIRSSRSITWQEQLDSCPEVIKAPIFIRPEEIERELTMPDWLNSADYGVVESVFKRNPEWKNTLIVMDVTGSMSPYIAKTMAWVRATQKSEVVAAFTFFNDGDAKRG